MANVAGICSVCYRYSLRCSGFLDFVGAMKLSRWDNYLIIVAMGVVWNIGLFLLVHLPDYERVVVRLNCMSSYYDAQWVGLGFYSHCSKYIDEHYFWETDCLGWCAGFPCADYARRLPVNERLLGCRDPYSGTLSFH